jgi:steroid delta-isomerase-like uncharacterized protein
MTSVLAFAGCRGSGGSPVSTEHNKTVVRRFLDEIVNKGSTAAADELLHPDFVAYPPGSSQPINRERFLEFASVFRSAFPDMHDTVEDIVAEGDRVAIRVTVHGTHRGEFQGIAPTGKPIAFSGFAIFRLANGKIVENRALSDRLGLMQQLGLPAGASSR